MLDIFYVINRVFLKIIYQVIYKYVKMMVHNGGRILQIVTRYMYRYWKGPFPISMIYVRLFSMSMT